MRAAILCVLLLATPAISQETTGSTGTEINGGFRTNTVNGIKVWRPFPPAPAPVVVRPPPPTNIVINQTTPPAVEPTYVLPIYGPRNYVGPRFQQPRRGPAQQRFPTPGRSGRSQWHNER